MRRHLVTGLFGTQDDAEIPSASDEMVTRLQLVIGKKTLNFGIQQALNDLEKLHVVPTEIGTDLLILAAHVYAADTRISRTTEAQDTWTREIRLVVPVSEPARWNAVTSLLSQLLNFLTGDKWEVGFRSRPEEFSTTVPENMNDLIGPPYSGVNLFSGGLDSLIGAIDSLECGEIPLLVSHAAEGATSVAQDGVFNRLKKHYSAQPFDRLRFWFNTPKNLFQGVASEDTTRGRSFLFFSLGIFAGTGINQPFTLKVPENGLIALNVPLDTLRLGSLSTRTTHPFYMARWNELLSRLGIDGRVENPYWNKTKGEMMAECSNQNMLQDALSDSMSCSSPAKARWLSRGNEHCGYCLPCIIRRASIEAALGQGNDPTDYTVDVRASNVLDTKKAKGQQVRSFQLAINRLKKRPDLAKILIHKSGSLRDETQNLDELAGVYQRGMDEVANLLAGVKTKPN